MPPALGATRGLIDNALGSKVMKFPVRYDAERLRSATFHSRAKTRRGSISQKNCAPGREWLQLLFTVAVAIAVLAGNGFHAMPTSGGCRD